ncbi:hypothetical protein CMI37_08740 [Candidatus Pacearchaeota archaeon]|nr:hypothetical protein [Candidatus Pacearchaeota archaeon]|tara:strand:+ start:978 stop:1241 length:264 start_codon:yes stop_codon:yes gene_type:complete
MDIIWITFPNLVTMILSSLGFVFLSVFLYKILTYLNYRLLTGKRPESASEYKIFLLVEENKKLNDKIKVLEEENSKIINSLIKHIQR